MFAAIRKPNTITVTTGGMNTFSAGDLPMNKGKEQKSTNPSSPFNSPSQEVDYYRSDSTSTAPLPFKPPS